LGTKGQHDTPRPPKPLIAHLQIIYFWLFWYCIFPGQTESGTRSMMLKLSRGLNSMWN